MRTIPNPLITKGFWKRYFRLTGLLVLGLTPWLAHGAQPTQDPGAAVPCAVLEEFDGDVQILDAERESLLKSGFNSSIPCGGWISVDRGWAEVKHRQGYRFRIRAGSFVQFFDHANGRHKTADDHVVLFRGSMLAKVIGSDEELRILTANARTRLKVGRVLVTYAPTREETQVYAVTRTATLENRFAPEASMEVRAGEASSLNLGIARLSPSTPRAVSFASARDQLSDLGLEESELKSALASAIERRGRKLASALPGSGNASRAMTAESDYERHRKPASEQKGIVASDPSAERRMLGSTDDKLLSRELLFPKSTGKPQSRGIASIEPKKGGSKKMKLREIETYDAWQRGKEENEKVRLMKELDQIDDGSDD